MVQVYRKLTKTEWVEKVNYIRNFKCNYSLSNFSTLESKVEILCPAHGSFLQKANRHLAGSECPKCFVKSEIPLFLEKAKVIYKDIYDYSNTVYSGYSGKIKIRCLKHGEFEITYADHTRGSGCARCKGRKTTVDFIEESNQIHNFKYDYSKAIYKSCLDLVTIICPKHGEFQTKASWHTANKQGCKKCGYSGVEITGEEYLIKVKERHGDRYDYSKMVYTGYKNKIKVICKQHEEFTLTAKQHVRGGGCQKCSHVASSAQKKIVEYLELSGFKRGLDFFVNDRKLIKPLEVDIYLPSYGLAIEVNGLYWHSAGTYEELELYRKKHSLKKEKCKEKKIKLLHFKEFEIHNKAWVHQNFISKLLFEPKIKFDINIYSFKELDPISGAAFFEKNYFNSALPVSRYAGLFEGSLLVKVYPLHVVEDKIFIYLANNLVFEENLDFLFLYRFLQKNHTAYTLYLKIDLEKCDSNEFTGFTVFEDLPPYSYLCTTTMHAKQSKFEYLELNQTHRQELQNLFAQKYRVYFDCGFTLLQFKI